MNLEELAIHYRLDKCIKNGFHNYIPAYEKFFSNIRDKVKNLLEIGIGSTENGQMIHTLSQGYRTGNSLRCWRDYFPNANIFGVDIFPHTIEEERLKVYQADQSDASNLVDVARKIGEKLDIIIDDGSHVSYHQVFSFMVLERFLAQGGIYVIEDIQPSFVDSFKDFSVFPGNYKEYILQRFEVYFADTRTKPDSDDFMMIFIKK